MSPSRGWKAYAAVGGLLLAVTTAAALGTRTWVLAAAPIGLLFGFFLERSELCGSSAFSEVVLMRDTRKLEGLWVVIATSMVMFAAGSALGWIQLNPKPLLWANDLVGGVVFGVGIVLAGGCISGALFKAGQGNLNSMAALVAIPTGVSAVAYGPLHGFAKGLKQHAVSTADGGPVTLATLTGLPYWLLAVVIAAATLGIALVIRRRRAVQAAPATPSGGDASLPRRILTRPWKPWQSGLAIGVLALLAYTSSAASGRNYPLGTTHGVLDVQVLLTDYPVHHTWQKAPVAPAGKEDAAGPGKASEEPSKHVVWWLVVLVVGLVLGSFFSAKIRGSFALRPKPPDEMLFAFAGGLLAGAGAAIAGGCVVGNIMSGVALMSVGNILFFVVVVLVNWATTRVYMVGFRR